MSLDTNKPLTEQEYVNSVGVSCPICYETEGVGTDSRVYTDSGVAWQDVSCSKCGATWSDDYNLVGYSQLEMGGEE